MDESITNPPPNVDDCVQACKTLCYAFILLMLSWTAHTG